MRTPEQEARRVFGQRAAAYTTSASHTDADVLANVVRMSHPASHWNVLDVATGTGHTAFALSPHAGSITGIDLTPEMLTEARKLAQARSITNVSPCLADVHHLPFEGGSFHLITCRRAAHHFSNITRALSEMKRVLRKDGRLVIDDRSVPDDDTVDSCMNELDRYHDESHVRQYRPDEWRRMLEGLGLLVEEVIPYTKHRPLSSLTAGVSRENVQRIHEVLGRLDVAQGKALNLRDVDSEPHLNHWYVTISARMR
jgi:ubiquinone/menaquinone biosynthesis C-methylase UbiE